MLCRYTLSLSVLLGMLWGCQAQESITEVRDGVTYVTNPRHGSHQDQATTPLRFELEQVFGAEEEPRQALFARISVVVTDDQGNAPNVVSAHTLDLFDEEGKLLYSLSGEGDMPDIGRLAHVDAAGKLYTIVYIPYPQVRRYRVVLDVQ